MYLPKAWKAWKEIWNVCNNISGTYRSKVQICHVWTEISQNFSFERNQHLLNIETGRPHKLALNSKCGQDSAGRRQNRFSSCDFSARREGGGGEIHVGPRSAHHLGHYLGRNLVFHPPPPPFPVLLGLKCGLVNLAAGLELFSSL